MNHREQSLRLRSFFLGALAVCAMGVMLGGVQARNDNISPQDINRTRTQALEYFVTQSADGKTAYFWQLDVARGRTNGTDVYQADAVLLGVGEVDAGGGLNQTDVDRATGERTLFLEGFDATTTIDNR